MGNTSLKVEVQSAPLECFVLDKIGLPIISLIRIANESDEQLANVRLTITSDQGGVEPYEQVIERIDAHATIELEPRLRLPDAALMQVSEKYEETVRISLANDSGELHVESFDIDILPYDQWPGALSIDSLACFVTPNNTALTPVLLRASKLLGEWTGSTAFDGYQSGSTDRVRKMAGAIFGAIREQGIIYTMPPASFERLGQRVRFAGDVLAQHMGTCIDLAVLYASCLEAVGLNPFIVLVDGHAFAGVWLEERTFPEILVEDPSQIINRYSASVGQLLVAECTMLANDSDATFDQACVSAEKTMLNEAAFVAGIDLARAHNGGLTPMPIRVMGSSGWEAEVPAATDPNLFTAPKVREVSTAYVDQTTEGQLTKQDLWERSLLDLSLRNNLLNMRVGSRLLPLAVSNLDDLEDALSLGTALSLNPKPQEWRSLEPALELVNAIGKYEGFLRSEFASKRIRTFNTQTELTRLVTSMYRAAQTSIDETGSNTLFVTLGALRWLRPGDSSPHYAPLLLLPIDIVRKSARKGFSLVIRDEEPQLNVSLLEMLRRDFGIDIGGLDPLPTDEHGVDTRLVFNTFRHRTMGQFQWEVLEVACLGIFSFSQFMMWDDIHSHARELRQSPIVASLLEGRLMWDAHPMELPPKVERGDNLIAVEADASQLFAITQSDRG